MVDVNSIRSGSLIFAQFWSYLLICLGTFGHLLNIYVFTRRKLRSNPCVRYFLASTLSGLFVTYINIALRLLQIIYKIDAFGYSSASCKILSYLVFWAKAQTSWFIALASIDRFFCSSRSATMRSWSNVRTASFTIILATIMCCLANVFVLVQYTIRQGNVRCPTTQTNSSLFPGIWTLIIFSLGPSCIMLTFGLLTVRHIRQLGRRIKSNNMQVSPLAGGIVQLDPQEQTRSQNNTDRQLIQMMLVQCVYFSFLSTPVGIYWIVQAVMPITLFDPFQAAINDLFSNIVGYLSVTSACTTFYLFTLSSQLFRRELKHMIICRWKSNENTTGLSIPLNTRD